MWQHLILWQPKPDVFHGSRDISCCVCGNKPKCFEGHHGTFPAVFLATKPDGFRVTFAHFQPCLRQWVSVLMDKVISDLRYSCAWTLEKGKRGIHGENSLRVLMELICCNMSYKGNMVNTLSQLWCEGAIGKITPNTTPLLQGSSSCHNKTATYITCNPNGVISDTSLLIVFKPLGSSGGGTQPGSFLASDLWQINF